MAELITREEIVAASEAGEGPKLYAWSRMVELIENLREREEQAYQETLRARRSEKDLLEALKALTDVPDVAGWPETEAAKAAIAKAEGK